MSAWAAQHRKLIVSVAGAAATVAIQAGWTANPWVSLAILAATAAGVYRAPNAGPVAAPAAPASPAQGSGGGPGTIRVIPGGPPPPPFLGSELGERPGQSGSAPVIPGHGTGQPVTAEPAAGTGGFPPSAFPGAGP